MNITTVGIDLAKLVFQVHVVNARGKAVLRKQMKRAQVSAFFAQLPACLIGMEACGGAHFWARKLTALGHTVKLIAPQFVKPYVKTNKNDVADAEAIIAKLMQHYNEERLHATLGYMTPATWHRGQPEEVRNERARRIAAARAHRRMTNQQRFTEAA